MNYVQHPWINPNTIEYRSYQDSIVKAASASNTLCVIPTGLGKTSVSALVAANRLERYRNSKIMMLAPTRPLVEQHRKAFEKFLKLGVELETVTGGDKPENRQELYKSADIIFSTPQTVRNDLKKGVLHFNEFALCIFDEAHRCTGNYAYTYIAKMFMHESKNPLILGLTASPGSHKFKIDEIKNKLSINHVEIRSRDDRDVKPYIQTVQNDWVEVELGTEMKAIRMYLESVKNARIKKLMDWRIINSYRTTKSQLLRLQQELARKRTGFGYAAMSYIAEIVKVDHALLLLETQTLYSLKQYLDEMLSGGTKAVERLKKESDIVNAVRLTNELVKEGKEHPKIEKLKEIVKQQIEKNKFTRIIVFAQFRSTINKIYEELKGIKNAAPIEFIGQAKKHGKGLSQKEQTQILNEFRMGFYNILCASQVAEEGLDVVETDIVIFYEPVPSAIRKIQRAGRTARTHVGSVIVMIAKNTRDEAYNWSAHQKERKMKKILYDMQKKNYNQIKTETYETAKEKIIEKDSEEKIQKRIKEKQKSLGDFRK